MEIRRAVRDDSAFDRVTAHLRFRGCRTPVTGRLKDDVVMLVRKCDEVRSLGQEYGGVELSQYMKAVLRVSRIADFSPAAAGMAAVSV
jgi:hypothetical protein